MNVVPDPVEDASTIEKINRMPDGDIRDRLLSIFNVAHNFSVDIDFSDGSLDVVAKPLQDDASDLVATKFLNHVLRWMFQSTDPGSGLKRIIRSYIAEIMARNGSPERRAAIVSSDVSSVRLFINDDVMPIDKFYLAVTNMIETRKIPVPGEAGDIVATCKVFNAYLKIIHDLSTLNSRKQFDLYVEIFESYLSTMTSVSGVDVKSVIDGFIARHENMAPDIVSTLSWILTSDNKLDKDVCRRISYRIQAYESYPYLENTLALPEVTSLIDSGKPIGECLRAGLHLTKGAMKALASVHKTLSEYKDGHALAMSLVAYGNPLETWHKIVTGAMAASNNPDRLLRTVNGYYFMGVNPFIMDAENSDAAVSFANYVLRPAIAELAAREPEGEGQFGQKIMRLVEVNLNSDEKIFSEGEAVFKLRTAIQAAIIGNRSLSGLLRDAAYCHRFSSSIEASWAELSGDTKPWEPLTGPWTSEDGRFSAIPLTSVAMLVNEGLKMRHCVGGYAAYCRTGKTHIYSILVNSENEGTLEINLSSGNLKQFSFSQFKGFANSSPSPLARQAVIEFHDAINQKKIRMNPNVLNQIDEAEPDEIYVEREKQAEEFSRACKIWPIFRDTLLSGEGDISLEGWLEKHGLDRAVHAVIEEELKNAPGEPAPPRRQFPRNAGDGNVFENKRGGFTMHIFRPPSTQDTFLYADILDDPSQEVINLTMRGP